MRRQCELVLQTMEVDGSDELSSKSVQFGSARQTGKDRCPRSCKSDTKFKMVENVVKIWVEIMKMNLV